MSQLSTMFHILEGGYDSKCSPPYGKIFRVMGNITGGAVGIYIMLQSHSWSKISGSYFETVEICTDDLCVNRVDYVRTKSIPTSTTDSQTYELYESWTKAVSLSGIEYHLVFGRELYKQTIKQFSFVERTYKLFNEFTYCSKESHIYDQSVNAHMVEQD